MKFEKRYIIVLLFVIIQAITVIRNIQTEFYFFFWLCDFAPILFAAFFFFNRLDLVKSLVSISIIPQWIYLVGLIYGVFSNHYVFIESTEHLFSLYFISSTFVHFTSTFALIFSFKYKPEVKQLKYTFILIILIYLMTLIFTSPDYYANYVYSSHDVVDFKIPYHTQLWPISVFILVALPGYLIQLVFYKYIKIKERE